MANQQPMSEPATMATMANAASTAMPAVFLTHPRDPGPFCGTDKTDVEEWLKLYERVSDSYRWDPTLMLANLLFYLKGTARQWYETHEADLTSWDILPHPLKRVRFAASAAAMSIQAGLTADSAIALVQRYLRKERLHWRPSTYASQGEEITPVQRNHTVKWLTVLNRYLKFNPETLFLSVTLMDEFLRLVRAQPKYLKCIAISCFYLASKIIEEDEVVPHIKDLIKNCDCIFSVSEITRMEALILKKLRWDLCRATSLDFLHGFYALLVLNRSLLLPDQSEQQLAALGPLLETKLQICLDQASLVATRPSTLALALLSLELETWTTNWFVITIALQRLAQVENSDVIRCREELACIFARARTAVSRKHRHSDSQNAHKPSKRRMETTDIEDIYDSIKRLYGEETASTTSPPAASVSCGMHQGQGGISMPGFPVRAM